MRKLFAALVLLAGTAHGQFLGAVQEQTNAQQVFTAQAANGASAILTNIGQSSHLLTYCPTSFIGTLSLEGSPDGTFTTPITIAVANFSSPNFTQAATQCRSLPAGGYYQTVRARVTNYVSGTISAWYTSVASPVNVTQSAINSNGPTSPVQCDETAVQTLLPNTNSTFILHATIQNIWVCSITIGFVSVPAAAGIFLATYGTNGGLACSTNQTTIWETEILTGQVAPLFFGGAFGGWLKIPAGQDFCLDTGSALPNAIVTVTYAQGFNNP